MGESTESSILERVKKGNGISLITGFDKIFNAGNFTKMGTCRISYS